MIDLYHWVINHPKINVPKLKSFTLSRDSVTWLGSVGSSARLACAHSHGTSASAGGTEMASHIWLTVGGSFWLRYLFFPSPPHGCSHFSRLNCISQQSIWILREQIWQFPSLFEKSLKTRAASFQPTFYWWCALTQIVQLSSRNQDWSEAFLEHSAS